MIDGHIHFEKQPYTLDIVNSMVETAISKGIDEIWLLDHTHKFKEFAFLYKNLTDETSIKWYKSKKSISIWEYFEFVCYIKSKKWPISIKFGLEVCFFSGSEEELKKVLKTLPELDFLIGSVHFVDGTAIDLSKDLQDKFNVDDLYRRYFAIEKEAVESQIFDVIGHPDAIKIFNNYPRESLLNELIDDFARTCKKYNQAVENNSGLIRNGFSYPGMSKEMLNAMIRHDVKFHKSSDAHKFEDIGRAFDLLIEN